jgi:cysteine desulfurase/selenocysteine lyase
VLDPYRVREDFPILRRRVEGRPLIYFDNAATSQKPIQVIEAVKRFYEEHNANVHRGVHTLSQEASELYERAHEEVAEFIGADGIEEIIFTKNTTEAINLIAYSFGFRNLGRGDEVVVTLMDHHSNIVPWENISKMKGFRVKYADINGEGMLDYESLGRLVTNRTRLLCVTHVSNVTGAKNDLERISRIAHDSGAMVAVDGAQSVPHMPIDVKRLGIDFLAFSGHKMLAPTGIGVLYGRREVLEGMEPFLGGGEMIREVRYNKSDGTCQITYNELPWKFEAGTPNISGGVGLMEAVRYLKGLGMEDVQRHEAELTRYALEGLSGLERIRWYGPGLDSERGGIIPFNMDGVDPHDLALLLDQFGIMVRSGFHCAEPLHQRLGLKGSVRASFYIYNTREEVDKLIEALGEIGKG